ncbi:hypothetical protein [Roseateles sp.]|uniref:hypothetical protein n=1 Tax=Roseateles sp. TaxID=1971397 RepID=UPI00286B794F|nr:hypothetical protein [Roseateles sp.]
MSDCYRLKFVACALTTMLAAILAAPALAQEGPAIFKDADLKLGLFPEEVTAVAAVLNQQHYKFK